jgi:hypothetical protein
MQKLLPQTGIGTALQNNYIAANATGLTNWSTTDRIDFLPTASDNLSFIFADGRQASSVPVGQTTAGRNVGPVPFSYGQAYAPKTAVGIIEETHIFTPHLINQLKWGYARYNGPTFNPDQNPTDAASGTNVGLSFNNTTPVSGQALQTFPIVPFVGSNSPTAWGGTIANSTIAENYTAVDRRQAQLHFRRTGCMVAVQYVFSRGRNNSLRARFRRQRDFELRVNRRYQLQTRNRYRHGIRKLPAGPNRLDLRQK